MLKISISSLKMSGEFLAAYVAAVKANDRMYRHGESLNGFKITKVVIKDYKTFKKYQEEWCHRVVMPRAEFVAKFRDQACPEWSKKDEFGELYGGQYWCTPDGSDPSPDAGEKTKDRNISLAADLPFSNHFKLWFAHEVLCPCKTESVQVLNAFCAFMADVLSRMPSTDDE